MLRHLKLHLTYKSLTILLAVSAIIYTLLFYDVTRDFHKREAELKELQTRNAELQAQNEEYDRELAFVQSNAGIELYAHEYGWRYPNETCYNAVTPGTN